MFTRKYTAPAKSPMQAFGYTQLQLATAKFYQPGITQKDLYDRDTNLRLGFRFLNELLARFNYDVHLALLAYNRGPARVDQILAQGGDPANGYSDAVLKGYHPPKAEAVGWRCVYGHCSRCGSVSPERFLFKSISPSSAADLTAGFGIRAT